MTDDERPLNPTCSNIPEPDSIDRAEIWRTVELCSCASVVFIGVLWLVNGPAVSTDQWVVRWLVIVVVVAAIVACTLRSWLGWRGDRGNHWSGRPIKWMNTVEEGEAGRLRSRMWMMLMIA